MSGKSGVYDANRIKFEKNVSNSSNIKVKLNYLKNLAESIQEEDNDFLYNQYKKFDSLSENSILTKYLSSSSVETNEDLSTVVFPFGINLSQEKAVSKALKNNISIIEGPPGTGKTQTILNIIANIMMKNKTIAVVSNNNSALENIFEKFEKENLSFFCAMLGKKDKKEKFIENQKCSYPKLTGIHNIKDYTKVEEIADNIDRVKKILSSKNKIATLKLELKEVKLEKKYFSELYVRKTSAIKGIIRFIFKNSKNILSFLAAVEYLQKRNKNFNIFFKIKSFFKYGVISQSIYKNSLEEVILYLQKSFYNTKEEELSDEIEKIEIFLKNHNSKKLLAEIVTDSMLLFKLYLNQKYNLQSRRKLFNNEDLWKNFTSITEEYPVVLSTTHSLRSSTGKNYLYDYLIIDEASQVDILSGCLSLSCAKNVIIVGDLMQLPHIVNKKHETNIDDIVKKYQISSFFNYKNSLLLSFSGIFKDCPKTLLKEHYRCHPKIIDFCNKKFYNNELIILTEEDNDEPLTLYNTTLGNHSRGNYNQRQIDVIKNEILIELKDLDVGIISPYRLQADKIKNILKQESNIEIDTVHKYQGREKDIIIITTVVDKENEFVDNANLLNVAISRAKNRLYVVVSDREKNKNMKDLVNYIKYNNLLIKESKIYSVFDLLYKNYAPYLDVYLEKMKNISEFKSENLMNVVIENILQKKEFNYLSKILHKRLNMIIKDLSYLSNDEKKFVRNPLTHVDFILYNKITKQFVLVIEVDGVKYHENNPTQLKRDSMKDNILEKYNIPIVRFKTNGSNEEEILIKRLKNIS